MHIYQVHKNLQKLSTFTALHKIGLYFVTAYLLIEAVLICVKMVVNF